jgi:hypothetical protein
MNYTDDKECSVYAWADMLRTGDRISSAMTSSSVRSRPIQSDWVGGYAYHTDFSPIDPPFTAKQFA